MASPTGSPSNHDHLAYIENYPLSPKAPLSPDDSFRGSSTTTQNKTEKVFKQTSRTVINHSNYAVNGTGKKLGQARVKREFGEVSKDLLEEKEENDHSKRAKFGNSNTSSSSSFHQYSQPFESEVLFDFSASQMTNGPQINIQIEDEDVEEVLSSSAALNQTEDDWEYEKAYSTSVLWLAIQTELQKQNIQISVKDVDVEDFKNLLRSDDASEQEYKGVKLSVPQQSCLESIKEWFKAEGSKQFLQQVENIELDFSGLRFVPEEIALLKNLRKLNLSDNFLHKVEFIDQCSLLEELDLSENNGFEEEEDLSVIENLVDLKILNANDTTLKNFPNIKNLKKLKELYLGDTCIKIEIPNYLSDLEDLTHLDLSNDYSGWEFSGEIFTILVQLKKLVHVDISRNEFSGEIPTEIAGLKNLERLYIQDNKFSGTLIKEIAQLTNLKRGSFHSNQFENIDKETDKFLNEKLEAPIEDMIDEELLGIHGEVELIDPKRQNQK